MSSYSVGETDVRFFRRVFAILLFAAISSVGGIVVALLMGPGLPG
ncbi:MAG: hypothetical protein ABWZ27_11760 [Aestuariivirgaceae bacterium]|jgi:hypothetical protein